MKMYRGYRLYIQSEIGKPVSSVCRVRIYVDDQPMGVLPERQDIRNHSPTGFEWGYGGSGPAQLALALVADSFGDEFAVPQIYQRVKLAVAKLPRDGWTLTDRQLDLLVAQAVEETGFVPEETTGA